MFSENWLKRGSQVIQGDEYRVPFLSVAKQSGQWIIISLLILPSFSS